MAGSRPVPASSRYLGPGAHPSTGTFAPDLTPHTDDGTMRVAELMRPDAYTAWAAATLRAVVARWFGTR